MTFRPDSPLDGTNQINKKMGNVGMRGEVENVSPEYNILSQTWNAVLHSFHFTVFFFEPHIDLAN